MDALSCRPCHRDKILPSRIRKVFCGHAVASSLDLEDRILSRSVDREGVS